MTTQQITERKNEELQQQGGQHVEPNLAVHGQRSIVSYARRCGRLDGRLERAWQQYASQYLLQLGSDPSSLTVAPDQQIDQEYLAQVYGRVAPLTVEIGSGQGENIVAAAAAHPEQNFLALEVYEPGLAHTMLLAGKQGLTNLKVARTDAPEFFAAAQACISEVWTFFPDPWPKMKHHKRRLVQASLAENISHALLENSVWRIATDIDDYALHVHEVMDHNDRFVNIGDQEVSLPIEHVGKGTVDQAQYLPHAFFKESERFTGRVLTNFERKGLAAGHTIHDFTYRVLKNSD